MSVQTPGDDAAGATARPAQRRVLFDAILHPHRSLSRRGFVILMVVFSAVSLAIGGAFFLSGAWPIFGFYGLDVAVLYFALRYSYRSAMVYENVRLTERELTVERGGVGGVRGRWSFQPYWLRVRMDDPPAHQSQVRLTSHGRSLVVGAFLSPKERLDFARALRAALAKLQRNGIAAARA